MRNHFSNVILRNMSGSNPRYVSPVVVFCLWYAIHGLLYERMYELYLLVAAISLVVLYCIVDYIGNVQGRTRVKLVSTMYNFTDVVTLDTFLF